MRSGQDAAGGEFKAWHDWECMREGCRHYGARVVGANPNCSQCGGRMRRLRPATPGRAADLSLREREALEKERA